MSEIIFCPDLHSHGVGFLIPKKRGSGFLKAPFGAHHVNKHFQKWSDMTFNNKNIADAFDIDGFLNIETKIRYKDEGFDELLNEILEILLQIFDQATGSRKVSRGRFLRYLLSLDPVDLE